LNKSRIHFMGIGGQGISAVAQMVLEANPDSVAITGCDMQASTTTRALQEVGIAVQIGHSSEHVRDIDKLIVVPAALVLNPDAPELAAARERGLPLITWQEMLGELMQGKCTVSVSGVHGKGSTTAMLSLIMVDAGLDPTCEVGAVVPRFGVNYRLGKSAYFVNEADEFYNNFWHYHPRVAIVTSIEFEHPEFFASYAEYLASFEHFVRGMDMEGEWPVPPTLILNADSPGCLELLARLTDWPGRILTYAVEVLSTAPAAPKDGEAMKASGPVTFEAYDVRLEGETSFSVRVRRDEEEGGGRVSDARVHLQMPGIYNVQNALAAYAAALELGVDEASALRTLTAFGGIRRRFEVRNREPIRVGGEVMDVILVDDYAHHPTAIAATLEAARGCFPGRRLLAVFQPHMYSRTRTFFEQFLHAFDQADVAVIADIFPARERDSGLVSARELVEAMARQPHFRQGASVLYGGDVQATASLVRTLLRPGDLALIMGAGDIYNMTDALLQDSHTG
jgi:UDP-N-acetylmuramate--alanine ligase